MQNSSQTKEVNLLRFLYPVWMVFGMFSIMYVPSKLVILGSAGETAGRIRAHELLFRSGIVSSLMTQLLFIFAVLLLYQLFESVNKRQGLLMVVLGLVSVPIAMLNELDNIAALILLPTPEQMMLCLKLHDQGVIIASIFWGLWLFPLGLLIKKSGYFPKAIGWAVILAGIGYTLDSLMKLLAPKLVMLSPVWQIMTLGEVVFLLWLVFRGAKLMIYYF